MRLPQTLTLAEARSASQQLQVAEAEAGAGDGSTLSVDASALTEFDSAALALLLQARRQANALGVAFEVNGAPDKLAQLARLYGVDELLGLRTAA